MTFYTTVQPPSGLLVELAGHLQQRLDSLMPGQQALVIQVRGSGGSVKCELCTIPIYLEF